MTNADEYYVNRARHIAVSLDTETVRTVRVWCRVSVCDSWGGWELAV